MSYEIVVEETYWEDDDGKHPYSLYHLETNNLRSQCRFSELDEAKDYKKYCSQINKNIVKVSKRSFDTSSEFYIELTRSYISRFLYWLEEFDGVEIYKQRERRFFTTFSIGDVYFRVLGNLGTIQVGDNNFDRWANSVLATLPLPKNKHEFIDVMSEFNEIKRKERGFGFSETE